MIDKRFDVLIVGSGPAGSIAALVLARGGARVALVDKTAFPRDKACGDLIGPRGVQLLRDLALEVPDAPRVSDMLVVGPTGSYEALPAPSHDPATPLGPYKDARAAVVREFEFDYLQRLLREANGNVSQAARAAKMDRSHLIDLLHRHGLKE